MFRKKKRPLDGKPYKKSLISKNSDHRFYDQLRSANRQYEETWFSRIRSKLEQKRRMGVEKRTLKRIEKRQW